MGEAMAFRGDLASPPSLERAPDGTRLLELSDRRPVWAHILALPSSAEPGLGRSSPASDLLRSWAAEVQKVTIASESCVPSRRGREDVLTARTVADPGPVGTFCSSFGAQLSEAGPRVATIGAVAAARRRVEGGSSDNVQMSSYAAGLCGASQTRFSQAREDFPRTTPPQPLTPNALNTAEGRPQFPSLPKVNSAIPNHERLFEA